MYTSEESLARILDGWESKMLDPSHGRRGWTTHQLQTGVITSGEPSPTHLCSLYQLFKSSVTLTYASDDLESPKL